VRPVPTKDEPIAPRTFREQGGIIAAFYGEQFSGVQLVIKENLDDE
jgi:ribosomal protein L25 (general stress protein Ctc)